MMSANDESSLDEDFGQPFEQSLKSVKPGEVVTGKVADRKRPRDGRHRVQVRGTDPDQRVPRPRRQHREVQVGDDVDVYFEASEGDTGAVSPSRAKAEQVKVWRDIEIAYNEGVPIEGLIVGKVRSGPQGSTSASPRSCRLARRPPSDPQPRSLHRPRGLPVAIPNDSTALARQRRRFAPRGARARALALKEEMLRVLEEASSPRAR